MSPDTQLGSRKHLASTKTTAEIGGFRGPRTNLYRGYADSLKTTNSLSNIATDRLDHGGNIMNHTVYIYYIL